jgi:hypothetical protein
MSFVDFVIIAAVAFIAFLCVRSMAKSGTSPECAACASSSVCTARTRKDGVCPVAKTMVEKAEKSLTDERQE